MIWTALTEAFFFYNYSIIKNNPFSHRLYLAVQAIENLCLCLIPICVILGYREIAIYTQVEIPEWVASTYSVFTLIGDILNFLTFFAYVGIFMIQYFRFKPSNLARVNSHKETERFSLGYKVLLTLFILNEKIFRFPVLVVYLRQLYTYSIGHNYIIPTYSIVLVSLGLIFQICTCYIFCVFLTSEFALERITWTKPKSDKQWLHLILIYLVPLQYMFSIDNQWSSIVYSLMLAISLIYVFMMNRGLLAYNLYLQHLLLIKWACVVTGSIFMLIICVRPHKYPKSLLMISYCLFCLALSFMFIQMKKKAITKNLFLMRPKKIDDMFNLLIGFTTVIHNSLNDSLQSHQQALCCLKLIGDKHTSLCLNETCTCRQTTYQVLFSKDDMMQNMVPTATQKFQVDECRKRIEQMALLLIQINLKQNNLSDKTSKTVNAKVESLKYILLFKELMNGMSIYSVYFEAEKNHNCRDSNFSNCYSQFQLKQIVKGLAAQTQIDVTQEQTNFQQSINYESLLKEYILLINEISGEALNYWLKISKHKVENDTATIIARKLLRKYKRMIAIYEAIGNQCGPVLNVELLTWKFYKDVMNFEEEADQRFVKIKSLVNQTMIARKFGEQRMPDFNKNHAMLIVGAEPKTMQKIILANNYLIALSGFRESDIVGKNVNIFQPIYIDRCHEKIVTNFVYGQTQVHGIAIADNLPMKNKDNTIQAVNFRLQPRITDKGLVVMTFITPTLSVELWEEEFDIEDVFYIMTDEIMNITHFCRNCIKHLHFGMHLLMKQVKITEIFQDFDLSNPDFYDPKIGVTLNLNIHRILVQEEEDDGQLKSKVNTMRSLFGIQDDQIQVQMTAARRFMDGVNYMNKYTFTIIGKAHLSPLTIVQEPSHYSVNGSSTGFHKNLVLKDQGTGSSIDLQSQNMSSLSSQSSSNSNESQAYKQVMEIKTKIDFKHTPRVLKRFSLFAILKFVVLIGSCIALFVLNQQSNKTFINNVHSVKNMKTIRTLFTAEKLDLLMIINTVNVPSQDIEQKMSQALNITSLSSYFNMFQKQINITNPQLHSELHNFSLSQATWDTEIIKLVNQNKIQLNFITDQGTKQNYSSIFYDAMQNFANKYDGFGLIQESDFNFKGDLFQLTNSAAYKQLNQANQDKILLLQDIQYCIINAADILTERMTEVNDSFMEDVYNDGASLLRGLLYFTWIKCVSLLIVSFFVLPFFFRIETLQYKSLLYCVHICDNITTSQIDKIEQFINYIEEIRYLNTAHISHSKETTQSQSKIGEPQQQSIVATFKKNASRQTKKQKAIEKSIQKHFLVKKVHLEQTRAIKHSEESSNFDSASNDNEERDRQVKSRNDFGQFERVDHMKQYSIQNLRKKTVFNKFKIVVLIYLLTAILCAFYTLSFYLNQSIYSVFQSSFHELEVHFNRPRCIQDSFFFLQFGIYKNYSLSTDSVVGQNLKEALDTCFETEQTYKQIKYQQKTLLKGTKELINMLDSNRSCDLVKMQGMDSAACYADIGKNLNMDSMSWMQLFLSAIQAKHQTLLTQDQNLRSAQYNAQLFYDPKLWKYIQMMSEHLADMFKTIQLQAPADLIEHINREFQHIHLIFGFFVFILTILQILIQRLLVNKLRVKILHVKFLLKMMPADVILNLKHKLSAIDITQF